MSTYYNAEYGINMSKMPWYTEKWYDEDLIYAMQEKGVEITQENFDAFKEYCHHIFDDKTDRNALLGYYAESFMNKTENERLI